MVKKRDVAGLIEALKDRKGDVRLRAARVLGERGAKSAVPALIEALEDVDWEVGLEAIKALGEIGDKSAVPALIKRLRDQEGEVCEEAIRALGEIGDKSAAPALLELLKDEDRRVIDDAIEALSKFKLDERAVEPLVEALYDSPWFGAIWGMTIERIVVILGEIGDKRAVKALVEISGLGEVTRFPTAHPDDYINLSDPAQAALSSILADDEVPSLIENLNDKDQEMRCAAARALGEKGDKSAVPALIEARKDVDWRVRLEALQALEKLEG